LRINVNLACYTRNYNDSARYMLCPCLRSLTQVGVLSKWLNIGSRK